MIVQGIVSPGGVQRQGRSRQKRLKNGRPAGTVLREYSGPEPKLLKGESILDAVERLRRRGRELKADLHSIASAPFPAAHAKQRMKEQIEALAIQGAPIISDLIEHDRKIIWPTLRVQSDVVNAATPALAGLAFAEVPDGVALTCWLHKDALVKRLAAEIDSEADDGAAMSHEARQIAEAEIAGDLLDAERQECFLFGPHWPRSCRFHTGPTVQHWRFWGACSKPPRARPCRPDRLRNMHGPSFVGAADEHRCAMSGTVPAKGRDVARAREVAGGAAAVRLAAGSF
jgi:hypothetical protein